MSSYNITKEYKEMLDKNWIFYSILDLKHPTKFFELRDLIILNSDMCYDEIINLLKQRINTYKGIISCYDNGIEFGIYYKSSIFPIHRIAKKQ